MLIVVVPGGHLRACIVVEVQFEARGVTVSVASVHDAVSFRFGGVSDPILGTVQETEAAVGLGQVPAVLKDRGVVCLATDRWEGVEAGDGCEYLKLIKTLGIEEESERYNVKL